MGRDFYWVYPYDSANPDANITEDNWMYSKGGIPYVSFDVQQTKHYAKIVVALVLNGKGDKICIKDEQYDEVYTSNFLIKGLKKEMALCLDINDGDDKIIDNSDNDQSESDD